MNKKKTVSALVAGILVAGTFMGTSVSASAARLDTYSEKNHVDSAQLSGDRLLALSPVYNKSVYA